jgi:hypothetical protein
MSRRGFRVVVGCFVIVACIETRAAWAQNAEPPPESPPPAFVAPPPGYEPPTVQGQPAYAEGQPPRAGEPLPTLMTLDRMDSTSRLGVQLGFDKVDRLSISDFFVLRFEPYGQYVFPGGLAGIYGQVPIARLTQSNQPDATGVGNLDLGGFFMPTRGPELIIRAGFALATATDSGDGSTGIILSQYERLTDLILAGPNYTALRLSGSTLQQSGMFFLRGDLGVDLAIDKPTGDAWAFLRANVAAGIRLDAVAFTAELVNLGVYGDDGDRTTAQRFFHTLAFGVRTTGEDQLHFGTVFPLDDALRGELWILSLGYQRAM